MVDSEEKQRKVKKKEPKQRRQGVPVKISQRRKTGSLIIELVERKTTQLLLAQFTGSLRSGNPADSPAGPDKERVSTVYIDEPTVIQSDNVVEVDRNSVLSDTLT